MARLEVRLLGKFSLTYKNKPINISSRPAQSLFAYLILNAGTAYRREKLAGMLWPDFSEETARDNLRHALWRVRKFLEAASSTRFLQADDLTISFQATTDYWLDAAELKKLKEDPSTDQLIAVLSQYQGELLPGFYDEWVLLEREHLYSIFEHHIARLISLLQAEKRWPDVLNWGERWIKLGQKPEAAYRVIMTAYAAQGDMSKVVATYERCTNSLRELGVKPSGQTRLLYEGLTAGEEGREAQSSLVEKAENRRKTNLPVPITSFIGREKEAAAVIKLVETNRLVTLTGPGGVGKTRLAIQSSSKLLSKFTDGVWWVELAPLSDEMLLPQAVAHVLGVRESPVRSLTESVMSFLAEKDLLLVLDNCEHLISACAQFSYDLLTQCAHLRILTTSREALDVMGEVEYPVQTLPLPALERLTLVDLLLEYEGIRLFVERANAKSGFNLIEQNAPAVLQICQRLDGIPLALELAAAQTKSLTAEQIAERLRDRFNLLKQGNRTALPRHQTLRSTIDWSFDLLSRREQILFRRLSVFVGSFTLDTAEAITSEGEVAQSQVTELLGSLINKSLVQVQERTGDPEHKTRYGMLETIRAYAREKLDQSGEAEQIRQRHCSYFLTFAEQAAPKMKGAEQFAWLDRVELEYDNLREVWHYVIEVDAELALRVASALLDFWHLRGNVKEGRQWLTKLLAQSSDWGQTAKRARVLSIAGFLAFLQDDYRPARLLLEEALNISRKVADEKETAFGLLWIGRLVYLQHEVEAAVSFTEECLTICEGLHDQWAIAMATYQLAYLAATQGRHMEADEQFKKSLVIFQELGDKARAAHVLNGLGEHARSTGNYERAGEFYEESIAIHRQQRSRLVGVPLFNLAWVPLHESDYANAETLFKEVLNLLKEDANQSGMKVALTGFASVLGMTGKTEDAARLFGAVGSFREMMEPQDRKEFDYYTMVVRRQLGETAFAKVWAEGSAMALEQAVKYALKESG